MSDIEGTRPVDPARAVPSDAERRPNTTVGQEGGQGAEQRADTRSREEAESQKLAYRGHDPAVSIAASTAHIENGTTLKAEVERFDASERPIIETRQAVFALKPDAGLQVGDEVSLKVVETDHRLTALLTEKNGRAQAEPPKVELIVTELKAAALQVPAEEPPARPVRSEETPRPEQSLKTSEAAVKTADPAPIADQSDTAPTRASEAAPAQTRPTNQPEPAANTTTNSPDRVDPPSASQVSGSEAQKKPAPPETPARASALAVEVSTKLATPPADSTARPNSDTPTPTSATIQENQTQSAGAVNAASVPVEGPSAPPPPESVEPTTQDKARQTTEELPPQNRKASRTATTAVSPGTQSELAPNAQPASTQTATPRADQPQGRNIEESLDVAAETRTAEVSAPEQSQTVRSPGTNAASTAQTEPEGFTVTQTEQNTPPSPSQARGTVTEAPISANSHSEAVTQSVKSEQLSVDPEQQKTEVRTQSAAKQADVPQPQEASPKAPQIQAAESVTSQATQPQPQTAEQSQEVSAQKAEQPSQIDKAEARPDVIVPASPSVVEQAKYSVKDAPAAVTARPQNEPPNPELVLSAKATTASAKVALDAQQSEKQTRRDQSTYSTDQQQSERTQEPAKDTNPTSQAAPTIGPAESNETAPPSRKEDTQGAVERETTKASTRATTTEQQVSSSRSETKQSDTQQTEARVEPPKEAPADPTSEVSQTTVADAAGTAGQQDPRLGNPAAVTHQPSESKNQYTNDSINESKSATSQRLNDNITESVTADTKQVRAQDAEKATASLSNTAEQRSIEAFVPPRPTLKSATENTAQPGRTRAAVPRFASEPAELQIPKLTVSPLTITAGRADPPPTQAPTSVSGLTTPIELVVQNTRSTIALPIAAYLPTTDAQQSPQTLTKPLQPAPPLQGPIASSSGAEPSLLIGEKVASLTATGLQPDGAPATFTLSTVTAAPQVNPTSQITPLPVLSATIADGPQLTQSVQAGLTPGPGQSVFIAATTVGQFSVIAPTDIQWDGVQLIPQPSAQVTASPTAPTAATPVSASSETLPTNQKAETEQVKGTAPTSAAQLDSAAAGTTAQSSANLSAAPSGLGAQAETRAALLRAQSRLASASSVPRPEIDTVPYRADFVISGHSAQKVEVRFSKPGSEGAKTGEPIVSVQTLATRQSSTGLRADVQVNLERGNLRLTLPVERIPFAGGAANFVSTPEIESALRVPDAAAPVAQALAVGLSGLPPFDPVASREGWPAYETAVSILAAPNQTNPLENRTTQGGGRMVNSVLFMLSVLGRGAPAQWIGSAEATLKEKHPGLLERLKGDIEKLGRNLDLTQNIAGDWRTLHIPFDYKDNDLSFLHFMWRREEQNGAGKDKRRRPDLEDTDGSDKFALGLELDRIGALTLEGEVGGKVLMVDLECYAELPDALKAELIHLFEDALDVNGYRGKLTITDGSANAINKLASILEGEPSLNNS